MAPGQPATSIDSSRRAALLALKLKALVRDHLGREPVAVRPTDAVFTRGAAIVDDGVAWILVADRPERQLGAAMAWAHRQAGVERIAIIAESDTGVLARRAQQFRQPIEVWHALDRLLVPAAPEPHQPPIAVDPAHESWRELIVDSGAEAVVEHGVLVGEVHGLEVCRVVTDPATGDVRLEVGVGAHDREAFLLIHGGRPTADALADVVAAVAGHRAEGAEPHPLNRLGAERLLRWQVLGAPQRIGARTLQPAEPPVPRLNVKDPEPCVAIGVDDAGADVVVVCSTGIDLDVVPFALDARARHQPDADLTIVVPERDRSPVTLALAAAAIDPPTVVGWQP